MGDNLYINILCEIERLVQYGLNKKLIGDYDISYTRNRLLEVLNLYEAEPVEVSERILGIHSLFLTK
jgi:UDPglucose--hexose-1-phosphate uridylyltransferase